MAPSHERSAWDLLRLPRSAAPRRQQCDQFADVVFLVHRVSHRHVGVQRVTVTSPVAAPGEKAGLFEFGDDTLRGPFGDAYYFRDVSQADVRCLRHAQ